jgi:hypothetical protein
VTGVCDRGVSGNIADDTNKFGLKNLKLTIEDDVLLHTGAV